MSHNTLELPYLNFLFFLSIRVKVGFWTVREGGRKEASQLRCGTGNPNYCGRVVGKGITFGHMGSYGKYSKCLLRIFENNYAKNEQNGAIVTIKLMKGSWMEIIFHIYYWSKNHTIQVLITDD